MRDTTVTLDDQLEHLKKLWDFANPESEEERQEFLERRHGAQLCKQFYVLYRQLKNGAAKDTNGFDDDTMKAMVNFTLRTGICYDGMPVYNIRSYAAMGAIVRHLRTRESRFQLNDLGYGDGRITLGLSTLLDCSISAIEHSKYAEKRMRVFGRKLGKKVGKNIQTLHADFRNDPLPPAEVSLSAFSIHPRVLDSKSEIYAKLAQCTTEELLVTRMFSGGSDYMSATDYALGINQTMNSVQDSFIFSMVDLQFYDDFRLFGLYSGVPVAT